MPLYQASVELPCHRSVVFAFVRQPANIVRMMAGPILNFKYQVPELLEIGSRLQFCLHRFGQQIEIVHEVVEFVEQERITLNQKQGPFRHLFYEFTFADNGPEQTHLMERVHFEGPGGFVGMMVTNAQVLEQLHKHISRGHNLLRQRLFPPAG